MTDASDEPTGEPPDRSADNSDVVDDPNTTESDAVNPDAAGPDTAGPNAAGPDAAAPVDDPDADHDTPERNQSEVRSEDVEEQYDFENFGPRDMAEMSYEEWDAAFDSETWITGPGLLDRVENDLKSRVAKRDVFAVIERIEQDGESQLLAYSDEGYAVVYPDGTVEGSGTVLRDVKPSVALASMESYEVPDAPEGKVLPEPAEVPEGSGQLGNQLMQIIAGVHVLAGIALFVAWFAVGLPIVAGVAAAGFLFFGVFVFLLVANARLSDRFRAEEYRNRLRAVGLEDEERPDFLPGGDDDAETREDTGTGTAAETRDEAETQAGAETREKVGETEKRSADERSSTTDRSEEIGS